MTIKTITLIKYIIIETTKIIINRLKIQEIIVYKETKLMTDKNPKIKKIIFEKNYYKRKK